MSEGKLKTIDTLLRPITTFLDTGPKKTEKIYGSSDHKEWAKQVLKRAGYRCQWPGCTKRSPEHRIFADHIVELKDGGAALDVENGQALCGTHHTLKTGEARAERHGIR